MENLNTNSPSSTTFKQHTQVLGALNEQSDTPDAPIQFLEATGQILSVWSFEEICLAYVKESPSTNTLPIRLILELSKLPKGPWAVLKSLSDAIGNHKPVQNPRKIFAPLINQGFLEIVKSDFQCRTARYFLRLTDKNRFVSATHPDGRVMRKIQDDLKTYSSAHRRGSNCAGLVMTSVYVRKLGTPTDIAEQIYGTREISDSTKTSKISKALDYLGILDYQSLGMGRGAKAQILEVGK